MRELHAGPHVHSRTTDARGAVLDKQWDDLLKRLTNAVITTASTRVDMYESELRRFDADRDGKLNEQEQAKWEADVAAKSKETRRRNLEKYDADGDGKLSEGEKDKRKADENAAKEARKAEREVKKKS